MPTAGTTDTVRIELDVYDGSTVAELGVQHPHTGVVTDYETTASEGGRVHETQVPYPVAGLWWHFATITGTGQGFRKMVVPVEPAGPSSDDRIRYATTTDLANALHEAPPLDADRLLVEASRDVDRIVNCAIYAVDDDGYPTNPVVADALRDAVCEIVKWRMDTGDTTGAGVLFTSSSVAGVSLSRAQQKGRPDRIGQPARAVLAGAGLLAYGPQVW